MQTILALTDISVHSHVLPILTSSQSPDNVIDNKNFH